MGTILHSVALTVCQSGDCGDGAAGDSGATETGSVGCQFLINNAAHKTIGRETVGVSVSAPACPFLKIVQYETIK